MGCWNPTHRCARVCCSRTAITSPAVWTLSTSAPTSLPATYLSQPTDGTRCAWTTPLVAAAHGWCMTLGIELLLAADVRIAATGTRFAQLEVQRGIYPFGGATLRLPREAGWGNAMRWLLTGDEFDAAEAHRIGLVQQVAADAAEGVQSFIERRQAQFQGR